MKKWTVYFLIMVGIGSSYSETFQQKIDKQVKTRQITETDALFLEALMIFEPERLTEEYKQLVDFPVKCGFGMCSRIKSNWGKFNPDQKGILKSYIYRPNPMYSYISVSGLFKIHYDTTGVNGVSPDDIDNSGVPDYIEEAARALDHVYQIEVEQLGFNPPPDDRNRDGPEWDVFIRNITSTYGWTQYEQRISQNPDVYFSYMELDNEYTHTKTTGLDGLRVTAAHEFFHMIQLGYNFKDEYLFIMEAASTWMEDVVYDYINDYYNYLPIFFDETNVPFDHRDNWREYGLCLWFHFLEKRFWSKEIVRSVWEKIVQYPAVEAIDVALRERGHTFGEELTMFYGWNYITGSRADTVNFYPEGDVYPEIKLDGSFSFQLDTTITEEIVSTASKYYRFSQDDGTSFTLVPTNTNWKSDSLSEQVTIALIRGMGDPLYTSLGHETQTRLISDNYLYWKCTAVVESPDQETVLIPFSGTQQEIIDEDLPSAYPNPFIAKNHSMVTIPFILDEPRHVEITVLSASGYLIKEDEQFYKASGLQFYYWNGKDEEGRSVPGGIYVYIVAAEHELIRKNKFAVVR